MSGQHLLYDGQGTTRGVIDSSGDLAESYAFDAYGEPRSGIALTNPVYIGKVTHTRDGKTEVYSGRHEAIIDSATWDTVQSSIGSVKRDEQHRWSKPHLLQGKLRTAGGAAMSPTSVHRPLSRREERGRKRLVHYYISQQAIKQGFKTCPIKTINAAHLDDLVRGLVMDHAASPALDSLKPECCDAKLREIIENVTISTESIMVALNHAALEQLRRESNPIGTSTDCDRPTCDYKPEVEESDELVVLKLPIQIKKLDGKRLLLSPDGLDLVVPSVPEPRQHIVDAIGLAYRWHDGMLCTAMPAMVYAEAYGVHRKKIFEFLPLVQLGPQVLTAALRGTLPPSVTLDDLFEAAKDPGWSRQARQLRLPAARL